MRTAEPSSQDDPKRSFVRPAERSDFDRLVALRRALWPQESRDDEHADELTRYFAGEAAEPLEILVAQEAERLVGFCELSIRAYAEDCDTDHVGYLEGWYVVPDRRGDGVGRALVEAGEAWARSKGCTEFASDAEADNQVSIEAHQALGFEDAGLIRCFRKDL